MEEDAGGKMPLWMRKVMEMLQQSQKWALQAEASVLKLKGEKKKIWTSWTPALLGKANTRVCQAATPSMKIQLWGGGAERGMKPG